MFVLHLITLHIGHKKHQSSSHIMREDAHKIWGHDFISKWAFGAITVLLAKASKIFADFSSKFFIGAQFEKFVEFSEV